MFSCNLPPALLAEWLGSFTCYCSNMGVDGYQNKSQHRKLTLEKKILPPLQQGFEPATFWSRVRRSNHSTIPAPLKQLSLVTFPLLHKRICSLQWFFVLLCYSKRGHTHTTGPQDSQVPRNLNTKFHLHRFSGSSARSFMALTQQQTDRWAETLFYLKQKWRNS